VSEDAAAAAAAIASRQRLAAVMHAGGVLADALLQNMSPSLIRRALAPKVAGLGNLQLPMLLQPAARSLLFSSVAALLGSPGQANYSAANAALDAAALCNQQFGLPTTSVQWGAWSQAGMAAQDRSTLLRVQRMGMAVVTPAAGLAALRRLQLAQPAAPAVVAGVPFVPERLLEQQQRAASKGITATIYSDLVSGAAARPVASAAPVPPSSAAPAAASRDAVQEAVLAVVRSILGAGTGQDEPLMAAGLDSLGAVELRNSLEGRLGVRLSSTLTFDYPTAAAIADHIAAQLQSRAVQAGGAGSAAASSPATSAAHEARIAAEVAGVAAEILGTAAVDAQQSFLAAGLDSLGAVELRNSLEGRLGLSLPSTLVFDYPTVAALSAFIASRLQPAASAQAAGAVDLFSSAGSDVGQARTAGPLALSVAALATRSPQASVHPGATDSRVVRCF
jgi:acyl carrier protein